MFEISKFIGLHFLQTSSVNITNTFILLEKCEMFLLLFLHVIASHIFSAKISKYLDIIIICVH